MAYRAWIQPSVALLLLIAALRSVYAQPLSSQQDTANQIAFERDPANLAGEQIHPGVGPALPADSGAAGLDDMLRRLATRASLLMIVAHPDDEDGGMLTYASRGLGARVGMLTLTRGEGGQNLMSADFNDALGLVRTRELLAADRFFAVDQFFGTEVDFGFSKSIEESFDQWTHERVLYDAVRAVRLYRPLVLTSVFVGAASDGHGQHQVSGEITQEVFKAAADPKIFPEMGLPPWAPAKVYARVPFAQVDSRGIFDYATSKWVPARFTNYVSGEKTTTVPTANVTVPEGEAGPNLGKTYVQFAREGLALQRSQIGRAVRLAPTGAFAVGYTRYGSRVPVLAQEQTFFDGIDTSVDGLADLASKRPDFLVQGLHAISRDVQAARSIFRVNDTAAAAPMLRDGLLATDRLLHEITDSKLLTESERFNLRHELLLKRVQFNQALVLALGLTLEAKLVPATAHATNGVPAALIPGQAFTVRLVLQHTGTESLSLVDCVLRQTIQTSGSWTDLSAKQGCSGQANPLPPRFATDLSAEVPVHARGQRPPFLRDSLEQPFYLVEDPALRNAPTAPVPFVATLDVQYGQARIQVSEAVIATEDGTSQPATVTPRLNLRLDPAVAIVPLSQKAIDVVATISPHLLPPGTLHLDAPQGWQVSPSSESLQAEPASFHVVPTSLADHAQELRMTALLDSERFSESFAAVGYPGLIRDVFYTPARTRVRAVDLNVPAQLRVGYLPGTGDAAESALRAMGILVTRLSVGDIAGGHLANFDTVLLGVRAYAAHPDLPAATGKLLDFARAGGTVIVQYNTAEYTGAVAPFPLSLGTNERVVEERDPVRLLLPDTPVLRWPNRITEHDFDGWIEERGHGFMGDWSPEYIAPTEVHDQGEDPQRGGLLIAPVGRGTYVYCAFALYRQLPEGVPGAYRLLANLLSLGRHP